MNDILYEIIKITDKNGKDRTDGRYPLRIGRRCKVHLKNQAFLEYKPRLKESYNGTLRTSNIENYEGKDGILKITTMNSIYYLKKLEVM